MNIAIIENSRQDNGQYIELTDGKQTASIWHGESYTSIRVTRSCHSRIGTGGKVFHDGDRMEQALKAYKSSQVRAMLTMAMELLAN